MSAKFFVDTNVFVYSFDQENLSKQARAQTLIAETLESNTGLISTQVIQEFLNIATQKFKTKLKLEDCVLFLRKVMKPLCVVFPDLALYETCLEIQAETRYSFYDSLILASAIRGGCEILYSEDLQDGQQVRGVRIVNPFR
jgi:predicted nucleic acid-binding protein